MGPRNACCKWEVCCAPVLAVELDCYLNRARGKSPAKGATAWAAGWVLTTSSGTWWCAPCFCGDRLHFPFRLRHIELITEKQTAFSLSSSFLSSSRPLKLYLCWKEELCWECVCSLFAGMFVLRWLKPPHQTFTYSLPCSVDAGGQRKSSQSPQSKSGEGSEVPPHRDCLVISPQHLQNAVDLWRETFLLELQVHGFSEGGYN